MILLSIFELSSFTEQYIGRLFLKGCKKNPNPATSCIPPEVVVRLNQGFPISVRVLMLEKLINYYMEDTHTSNKHETCRQILRCNNLTMQRM